MAGTGCNAATGQFALRPLISAGVIDLDQIIIDLKTGVSGAGRSAKENLLHAELSEGFHAYAVGGQHRVTVALTAPPPTEAVKLRLAISS